jgi:acyl-CoA synthetase (NDP forming)
VEKLRCLLQPRSAAIIGVSDRPNPGRIILENMLREGFPRERLHVVKPGREEIAGCRCHPDVDSLPGCVDLLVLAIDAAQVPETMERVLAGRKAESLIVIPGGLGERAGSDDLVAGVARSLRRARATAWRGPVVNGGNCLGIRSRPGRYDTLFIPERKLPRSRGAGWNLALLAQSGAFAASRLTKLGGLDPRYLVSLGNQLDLTLGDYLAYLEGDAELQLFACYVEGFRPGDGARWLEAAERLHAAGRTVILYRAGRTAAGVRASATHTAAIAGDYAVTRELARAAGVVLAESLQDFEDLTLTFALLGEKRPRGFRLGAVSNAGFECVAIADAAAAFELVEPAARTRATLERVLERAHLGRIVGAENPLDVTPVLDDEGFADAARALLEDPAVDVGVIGCVPMTPALNTLPRDAGHGEDLDAAGSIVSRIVGLHREIAKPFVAVVDAGPRYDPMAETLVARGVPTFRSADRAVHLLEAWCRRWLPGR